MALFPQHYTVTLRGLISLNPIGAYSSIQTACGALTAALTVSVSERKSAPKTKPGRGIRTSATSTGGPGGARISRRGRRRECRSSPRPWILEASSATRHLARKVINPMHHVRMLKENNERNRFLSREEQEILRRFLPVWLYLALVVAIATGIRRENLFSMRRDQIDWERRILRLPLTKDGYQQAVFLNEDALNALREQLGSHDLEWVWPNRGGMSPVQAGNTYTRIWLPALKEAGLAHITWHDLKHTTAQRLIEEGGQDLYTVQVLLNIKDPKTANRYAALSEKHLRNAIESTVKTDGKLPRSPRKPRKTR